VTHHHHLAGGVVTCTAPAGTYCRLSCPDRECGEWTGWECEHGPLVDLGHCTAAEWINANGLGCTAANEDEYYRDNWATYEGPIRIEYEPGIGHQWQPAPDTDGTVQ
jgi:hypothetical protein